jgi:hypothetical protein
MPGARFAPAASRAKNKKHTSVVTAGAPVSPGIPRAAGFNGFLRALPGEPGLLSPSPARSSPHRLDISVGISGPHDFAVRLTRARLARQGVHRIPRPTFCDDRETPLLSGRDARKGACDLPDAASENACGTLARPANQVRLRKSCQVKSNCCTLVIPGCECNERATMCNCTSENPSRRTNAGRNGFRACAFRAK